MNSTQLATAGSLPVVAARRPAEGLPALRPFRRLLDEVWRGSADRLSRLALGLGLKSDQAADVLQDVYLMALQKPPAIDEQAELARWLVRVTVNRCHLQHRRQSRWRKLWDSLGKVVVVIQSQEQPKKPPDVVSGEGAYLISGGSGALGLETAGWLW
jgi:DNA-directed RNA polymerase specialized sigma24 family protein